MCSNCDRIHITYEKGHLPNDCPISKCKYCSFCARSGHTTTECPYDEEIIYEMKRPSSLVDFILRNMEPALRKNPRLNGEQVKLWTLLFTQQNPELCNPELLRICHDKCFMKSIHWQDIANEIVEHSMPYILEHIYGDPEEEYFEVIDHEVNIRAVLIAFGIKLSGIKEINRQRVEWISERIGCKIRWIDPLSGESINRIDEKQTRAKKQKTKKQAPISPEISEDESDS